MKAYKGFKKDMTCRGYKFEEGKEYVEEYASLCNSGFHACLNPLDCLSYYPIFDSQYHEVDLNDVSEERENNDTKICGKRIKIGAKIGIKDIIKSAIDFTFENIKKDISDDAQLASSGNYAQLASSGNNAKLASSGNYAQLASSGNNAQLASSGNCAKLASSGNNAQLASSGNYAKLASSGNNAQLASSGNYAKLASSGNNAQLASSGNYAVIAAIGKNNIAKAKVGSWIVLASYGYDGKCVCVKSFKIDGVNYKQDTWYRLDGEQIVEVRE